MGNLRELKLGLDSFETMEIANFSAALTKAFELLEIYRNNSGGANCNQVRKIGFVLYSFDLLVYIHVIIKFYSCWFS
jgi:voltage-dependent calcium channel alpha-2/delta-3